MNERLKEIKSVLEGNEKVTKDQIIGRRVVLCESGYENEDRPFFCGDELTIKLIDGRMYHLEDDTGNCLVVLDKHIELV